jgi:hypothetical protein
VTETDDALRDALRDLIPDYTGPVDPLPRVVATVRRRRTRQRTMFAVGGTGLAVLLALAVPVLLLPRGAGPTTAAAPGAPATGPVPAATGRPTSPAPAPLVYPVASGTIGSAQWSVGTVSFSASTRLCLLSDDDVAAREVVCYDGWLAGDAVAWSAQPLDDKGVAVTRVTGIAPATAVRVVVRRARGGPLVLPARRTATTPDGRFFGHVLAGTVTVRSVTALDAAGRPLGPPVTLSAVTCPPPSPDVACATG